MDEKIKEIEPLQQVLGKLRSANSASRAGGLCSSEEELNGVVCFSSKLCRTLNSSYFSLVTALLPFMHSNFVGGNRSTACSTAFNTRASHYLRKSNSLEKSNNLRLQGKRLLLILL